MHKQCVPGLSLRRRGEGVCAGSEATVRLSPSVFACCKQSKLDNGRPRNMFSLYGPGSSPNCQKLMLVVLTDVAVFRLYLPMSLKLSFALKLQGIRNCDRDGVQWMLGCYQWQMVTWHSREWATIDQENFVGQYWWVFADWEPWLLLADTCMWIN